MFRFLAPSLSPTLPAAQLLAPRTRTRPAVVKLPASPPGAAPPAEQVPDELAEILFRVASGGSAKSSSSRSVGDAAATEPAAAAAAAGPSSAAMQAGPSTARRLAADDPHVTALIAGSSVALQLRRILQRDVAAVDDADVAHAGHPTLDNAHAFFGSLADTDVMNGPCHDDCLHPNSVWNELDRTPSPQSIMVCFDMSAPSLDASSVTLAERCCCDPRPIFGEPCRCTPPPLPPAHHPKHGRSRSWKGLWPFRRPKHGDEGHGKREDNRRPVVWYPSRTQLSIHASWWGYSIYLPPPVMMKLDDEHMDTLKRIAAVSTAINFILKALPSVVALTPPMLVAVGLLQGLAPIVGYIATFVSWSWHHVKSFDRGRGVILSATWAMPVALITRSWDAAYSPWSTPVATVSPASPPTVATPLSAAAGPVTSTLKAAPATPFTFTCSALTSNTIESDIALAVATPNT